MTKPRVITKTEAARRQWWLDHPMERVEDEWFALRPEGGFDLIMIDPPWAFSSNSIAKPGRNVRRHYQTAPLDWIKALPLRECLCGRDTLVWLWATNPLLDRAFEVLDAWGFRFTTAGHWAKTTSSGGLAFGTGHTLRGSGEPFLIGKVGRPQTTNVVRSVIMGPVREHSRKPNEAFEAAERLMPCASRIEVFSRGWRAGWVGWGDEAGKFGGALDGAV